MRWRHATGVHSLAFTRDGKGLITAGKGSRARLWDVATGRLLRQFGDSRIESKSSIQVRRWDRESGRELRGWSRVLGNTGPYSLVFSPDGKTVACMVWSATPDQVYLWETATGKEISRIAGSHPAFSPDGQLQERAEGCGIYATGECPPLPYC